MAKYSSKEQELFFKPWRVQVLIHWRDYQVFGYQVIIRDVSQQGLNSIRHTWLRQTRMTDVTDRQHGKRLDCWDYEPPADYVKPEVESYYFKEWHIATKADAIEIAKHQALRLHLPFDLQRDIVEQDEVVKGKELSCLVCGKNSKRTFDPFVCSGCQHVLEIGNKTIQETQAGCICASDLLESAFPRNTDYRKLSAHLAELLAQIARVQIGDRISSFTERNFTIKRGGYEGFSQWIRNRIFLSQEQAEAMTAVVNFVNEISRLAYTHGFETGKSLLLGLASGELSLDEFEVEEVKKARKQQGRHE